MASIEQFLDGGSKKFEEDFLSAHNAYRKQHSTPSLQISRELCASAQKWADHLAETGKKDHSGPGENLYFKIGCLKKLKGNEPVDSWYKEIKDYDYGKPEFGLQTGHFTQVVWKGSQELGCGVATDGKGCIVVVGQYKPPGNINMPGEFEKNVLPAVTN
ncbi:Golgi-associated plant pathogenesis-related 1-like [Pelobates cultripes]|uniref:Golgi-associated plant pathogenesis-related 1-like n=1 Tax=Pelobates cultripes TaxID=61616 RepID=A0AAD1WM61_PELCU|nr:Golgi-associated plant pathogenesis-related 1-like [Pelobates cultripes]